MPIHSLNGPEHAWICRHDGESWKYRQLSGRSTEGRLNIFALHPESPNAVTERLGGMIR